MATVTQRRKEGSLIIDQTWLGEQIKRIANQMAGKSAFEIGLYVESQAKSLAPVDTGRLAGSIHTVAQVGLKTSPVTKFGDKPIEAPTRLGEVYVGTSVDYAPYMEYGTVKTDAQPFLRPALAIAKGEALTIVEDNGKMAFKEYLK